MRDRLRSAWRRLVGSFRAIGSLRTPTVYFIIGVNLVMLGLLVSGFVYTHHQVRSFDARQTYRNCMAIENLKGSLREAAQATIEGDLKLLDDSDKNGTPLPVPRQAIEDDITAKQKVVDRFPARPCVEP